MLNVTAIRKEFDYELNADGVVELSDVCFDYQDHDNNLIAYGYCGYGCDCGEPKEDVDWAYLDYCEDLFMTALEKKYGVAPYSSEGVQYSMTDDEVTLWNMTDEEVHGLFGKSREELLHDGRPLFEQRI